MALPAMSFDSHLSRILFCFGVGLLLSAVFTLVFLVIDYFEEKRKM